MYYLFKFNTINIRLLVIIIFKSKDASTIEFGVTSDSLAYEIYAKETIYERHRHRYEINKDYKDRLESVGLVFSGFSPDMLLPEIVEYTKHRWFVAVQFHPEFTSRPLSPHPLFKSFIKATLG